MKLIFIKTESSRRTSNDFSRRNSNNSTNFKSSQSIVYSRRTSSVSDGGGMVSSRSSPGPSTPHVFISNSEMCEEILPPQDFSVNTIENNENNEKSSNLTSDSRRNSWKMYGRHMEPVGLFLLVPAVHTKQTVYLYSSNNESNLYFLFTFDIFIVSGYLLW